MINDYSNYQGNRIHSTAIVNYEQLDIGIGNIIGPYVCIGTDAQHIRESSIGKIKIGDNNIFREYTTVHLPTKHTQLTEIGSGGYFMTLSHIAHDCIVEDNVIFSNNVTLGGHCYIMKGSQFGFNVLVHQYQIIGSYCMIGMGTIIIKNVEILPGNIWAGNPVEMKGINQIGLERKKVSNEEVIKEKLRYFELIAKRK